MPPNGPANNTSSPAGDAAVNAGMNLYFATSERHVAPPKTSVQMAEWSGAFDAAIPSGTDPVTRMNAAWAIASKEEGGFYDAYVTDSTTTQYRTYAQPGRSIVTPPSVAPNVALALASGEPVFTGTQDIVPRGTALLGGQYVVFDTDAVMLPYLPDPNAAGIALQGLPERRRPFARDPHLGGARAEHGGHRLAGARDVAPRASRVARERRS